MPSEGGVLTAEGGMTLSEGGMMHLEGDNIPSKYMYSIQGQVYTALVLAVTSGNTTHRTAQRGDALL